MIKVLIDGREMVVDLDKNLVMSADGKPIPADSPLVAKAKQIAQKRQQRPTVTIDQEAFNEAQPRNVERAKQIAQQHLQQQQTTTQQKVAAATDKLQNNATKATAEQVGKAAGTLAAAGGAMAGSAAAVRNAADPNSGLSRDNARIVREQAARQQGDAQRNYQIASRDEHKEADKDAAAQASSQYQQTMAQISGAAGGGAAALAAMNVQKGDPNQHRQRADEAHKTATALMDASDANRQQANRHEAEANDADKLATDAANQNIKSTQYSLAPDYGAASEGNGNGNGNGNGGGNGGGNGNQAPGNGDGGNGNGGQQPTPGNGDGGQAPSDQQPTPGNGNGGNGNGGNGNGEQQPAPGNGEQAPSDGGNGEQAPSDGGGQTPSDGGNGNGNNGEQAPEDTEMPGLGFTLNDAQVGYTELVGKQSGATATSEEGKNRAIEYFKERGVSRNGDPKNAGAELQAWRRQFAGDSVDKVGNTTHYDASRMTGGEAVVNKDYKSDRRLKNILTAVNRRFY